MRSFNRNLLVFVQLLFVYIFQSVFAVVPLGILRIFRSQHEIFVSPASFATELPYDEFSSEYYKILELQGDSKLGCDTSTMKISNDFVSPFLLLIARGNCTFETKALNAQKLGASGVIIYNTIEGLYRNSEVAPPGEYECKNGLGYVQDIYYPVYGKQMIDTIPDSCTNDEKCASNTCVITKLNKLNNQGSKVCCAWDLYLSMGVSSTEDIISVNIPTVYIRLEDYRLLSADRDLQNGMMQAKMFSRPMYAMTIASFLVWCIAVGTLIIGSIKIASEEKMSFLSYKRNQFEQNNTTLIGNKSSDDLNDQFDSSSENSSLLSEGNIKFSKDTRASDNIVASHFQDIDSIMDDTLDISTSHAVGFVLTSSLFLIFLYFIDVYYIVVTIYLLCACVALFIVYFQPLLLYLKKGFGFISFQIQNVEVIDIIAGLLSISIAIIWFINTQKNWDWILQDLMGISVCILFLSTVRLPNLKVATVLLGLGFIYDIFFVFVSAFIFKSSIMLKVASGEEYTEESENFCEKYPNDFTCKVSSLFININVK